MFPDDPILIARGKHATLKREWHEQVRRVQDICRTVQATAPQILAAAQDDKPVEIKPHIFTMDKCLTNLKSASERLITLKLGLDELKPEAWGNQ